MIKEYNQLIRYGYGTRKDLASEKEYIKCNHIIKLHKK